MAEPFDGILGMARNKPFALGNNTSAVGPLFVDALAKTKVISDNRFSFSLGYTNSSTFVDFGVPQTNAMSSQNDLRDIYVENDFFWSSYCQGMGFNNTSLDNTFGFVNGSYVYSIFDTGAAGIMLSSDYFQTIVNRIYQEYIGTQNYVIKDGTVYSQCFSAGSLPTLYFLFSELWIEVKGQDYMFDVSPGRDMSLC